MIISFVLDACERGPLRLLQTIKSEMTFCTPAHPHSSHIQLHLCHQSISVDDIHVKSVVYKVNRAGESIITSDYSS